MPKLQHLGRCAARSSPSRSTSRSYFFSSDLSLILCSSALYCTGWHHTSCHQSSFSILLRISTGCPSASLLGPARHLSLQQIQWKRTTNGRLVRRLSDWERGEYQQSQSSRGWNRSLEREVPRNLQEGSLKKSKTTSLKEIYRIIFAHESNTTFVGMCSWKWETIQ